MNNEKGPFKRFICFSFDGRYPEGGTFDIRGSFDELPNAIDFCLGESASEFAMIFDCDERRVVWDKDDL